MMAPLLNAMRLQGQRATATTVVCRVGLVQNYNPQTYQAKVLLQPEAQLTGWLPIASAWIGNGWGAYSPPSINEMVSVIFIEGDLNSGYVQARLNNSEDAPLAVPSGEFWIQHAKGQFAKWTNDGKLTVSDGQGASVQLDGAGNIDSGATQWTHTGPLSVSGAVALGSTLNVAGEIATPQEVVASEVVANEVVAASFSSSPASAAANNSSSAGGVIPLADDTYTLGSPTFSFSQLYLGSNHAPALDSRGNLAYYKITAAETAAGCVIVNASYLPGNLYRYGATGGNATLDTAAWLAAVAQANEASNDAAEVVVPIATSGFFISTGAVATRPLKVRGYNMLLSLLVAQSDINLLILDNSGGSQGGYGCVLEDLGLTGIYTGATNNGLTLKSAHDTVLNRVRITGFGIGYYAFSGSSYNCKISDSRIEGNVNRNIYASAGTHALSMKNVAYGSSGSNLTPIGMSITDSNTLWQWGCDCEGLRGSVVIGLDIDAVAGTLAANHRIACHFENNANTAGEIRIGATNQIQGVVIDGTIMANTASGTYGLNLVNVSGVTWNSPAFYNNFGTANIHYGTVVKSNITPGDALTTVGTVSLPTQSTGWGTPTGASVENNYSGSAATLAQTSAAVAELISILKGVGILGP